MLRFLHLADVHLDTTFLCRSDHLRTRLRDALRVAFERAVDCALEERVDLVLIAGDLFDNERLSFTTENFLLEQLKRLHEAGIPCCYATGNHDPGGQPFRAALLAWPETFHVIRDRRPHVVPITNAAGDVVARVVGAGHVTPHEEQNLAAQFPVAEDGTPHIGLLHTMVTSAERVDEHDRYAPCSVEDLRRPGYRYWALGHIHVRQQVCSVANAHYPGNIQGRHPRETGPKGGLVVTLRDGSPPDVEFRPFAPVQWAELQIDGLEGVRTLHDLERCVRTAYYELAGAQDHVSDWLLRLVLAGPCPLAGELSDSDQRAELEEHLVRVLDVLDVSLRTERMTHPVNVDEHRGQPHLLGEVLAVIEELERDATLLEELAPDHLAAEDEDRRTYLRSLLEGLDREAAVRLLDEHNERPGRAS